MVKSIEAPTLPPWSSACTTPRRRSVDAGPSCELHVCQKYLDQDPNYYKQHAMGSGPFKLKEYVRGASIEMERNPKYWKQGLPYMDGISITSSRMMEPAPRRSVRTAPMWNFVAFRQQVEAITSQLGNKVTVAYPGQPAHWGLPSMWTRSP